MLRTRSGISGLTIGFDTFAVVQKEVAKIMIEDEKKTGGTGKPARFNPRANLWRRVLSKTAESLFVTVF